MKVEQEFIKVVEMICDERINHIIQVMYCRAIG